MKNTCEECKEIREPAPEKEKVIQESFSAGIRGDGLLGFKSFK